MRICGVFLHLRVDLLQNLPLLDVVLVSGEYCVHLINGVLSHFDLFGEGLQILLHLLLRNHHSVILHVRSLEERLLLVELCLTGPWLILNSLVWLWLAFLSLGFGMSFRFPSTTHIRSLMTVLPVRALFLVLMRLVLVVGALRAT